MLRQRPDLVDHLLEMVHNGFYELFEIPAIEITEVGGWLSKYRDQQISLADACLAYLADRENITTVFTVDQRHFNLFRTRSGDPLWLVPVLG